MTKEECEKVLKALYDENGEMDDYASAFSFDDDYIPQCVYETAREHCYDTLKQLIHEHFDNPPLSFDDLKAGMWVWDNKNKLYVQVDNDFNEGNGFIIIRYHEDSYKSNCERVQFKENRFYRRQKEG